MFYVNNCSRLNFLNRIIILMYNEVLNIFKDTLNNKSEADYFETKFYLSLLLLFSFSLLSSR